MGSAAHMMERPASVGNRLLAALPSKDLALLAPHLQKVSLEQDAVLAQSGGRRDHVYFPHSGAISFMLDLPNGETIATAVIGREGGPRCALGAGRKPLPVVRDRGRAGGRHRIANLRSAFSSSLHGEQCHQTCGPGAH
jgi:CRP-like cAMP-binding protein